MNHISTAFGLSVLLYLLWVAIAPTPIDTMDRACAPAFVWPEKALVSAAKIFAPDTVPEIEGAFGSGLGKCRAWVWGAFYEDEYQRIIKGGE